MIHVFSKSRPLNFTSASLFWYDYSEIELGISLPPGQLGSD